MMQYCEHCWENYDTEREDASKFFCPKCSKKFGGGKNGKEEI